MEYWNDGISKCCFSQFSLRYRKINITPIFHYSIIPSNSKESVLEIEAEEI
jgi:hypothetical protein